MPKKIKSLLPILLIIVAIIIAFYFINKPSATLLQGEVEANRVDISTRVQGRVTQLNFDVGDNVKQGDTLLSMSNPALLAQKNTVEAQLNVAIASRNSVYSTRPETIDAQKSALEKAESDLVLAKQSYERIKKLVDTGSISKQNYDEANNKYQAAIKAKEVAQSNLDLAINGNSVEAKQLADSQVEQAKAALAQINTDLAELTVVAPASGQITARVAEKGQLYNPGTPLYSIINLSDIWFVFNIREDVLGNIKVGDIFTVKLPALKDQEIEVRVTTLNALGQYANWRATKATGDFDLKTFEMRAKPVDAIDGLRPGMSAIAVWKSSALK